MNKWARRLIHLAAAGIGLAAILSAAANMRATSKPREIHVVVKGMAFYVNGGTTPNPPLQLNAGEEVRVVLTNEDPGMVHDFSVAEWKVATKRLMGKGEEDAVVFRVPKLRGIAMYQCTPHSEMMRGAIQVE